MTRATAPDRPAPRPRSGPRPVRRLTTAVLALALLACGGEAPSATGVAAPEWLDVVLRTPNADDGAVLLRIGGTVDSVIAAPGYEVYVGPGDQRGRRLIVRGAIASGAVARVRALGRPAGRGWDAVVEQAAARDSHARRALAGYQLTLEAR